MRSRYGLWDTGLLVRHLRMVLAGFIGVDRFRSGTGSGAEGAGFRIWAILPAQTEKQLRTASIDNQKRLCMRSRVIIIRDAESATLLPFDVNMV